MNFALILVLLSVITGLIALLDRVYLRKKRKGNPPSKWVEQAISFFPVFVTVVVLRSFLIEPFRIPSGSLEPTLRVGDFVAVNKFAYGIRLPVWEKKVIPIGEPKLGDIAVFRWPADPSLDYIKRVVGRPGDVVSYQEKVLSVNGIPAQQQFVRYTTDESSGHMVAEYEETLDGIQHAIYINPIFPSQNFTIKVPPHAYFMMGDNRDDSADSRFWGFVDESYLRGKAVLVWMSWDSHLMSVRWKRLGTLIH